MKVTVRFDMDPEEVGYAGTTSVQRENVSDLVALAQVFADAARASGFTYVEDVAFEKDCGTVTWGMGSWS